MKLCLGKPLLMSKNLYEPFKVIVFFSQMRTSGCQGVMNWKTTWWQLVLRLASCISKACWGGIFCLPYLLLSLSFLSFFPLLFRPSLLLPTLPPASFIPYAIDTGFRIDQHGYILQSVTELCGQYCANVILYLPESQVSHLWNGDDTVIPYFLPLKESVFDSGVHLNPMQLCDSVQRCGGKTSRPTRGLE